MSRPQLAELRVNGDRFRRGRLLLLRRRHDLAVTPGVWDRPDGSLEVGDGLDNSPIREVREETGFTVEVQRPIDAWIVRTRLVPGRKLLVAIGYYA